MNLLQRIFNIRTKKLTGTSYQIVGGQLISPADNKDAYLRDGYLINDIIYSIVSLIADKIRLPEWKQYKVVDESSLKSYNAIMRKKDMSSEDFKRAVKLKIKALEEVPGDAKLASLLKFANESETFQDFVTSGSIFKLITGDRYVYADILDRGANGGKPQSFHNLPSQHITIKATTDFPAKELAYELYIFKQSFTTEQILHEKYFNPDWNLNGQQLYGMSPLKAALKRYTRNNLAMTAAAAAFNNQGIKGIISPDINPELVGPDNVEIMGEQSSKVKKLLTSPEYIGADSYGKVVAGAYRMNWTNIGLSPVDLQIIESEKWDAIMLCNIYGVPPELLGLTQKTYNNVKEAEKALTSRSAFPLLTSFRDYFNMKLQKDWGFGGKNIYVDYDQTVFTEMEENTADRADWVSKLWMLSPNQQLELMNLPKNDDPLFDEVWVDPNGKVPLSDYNMNQVDSSINANVP